MSKPVAIIVRDGWGRNPSAKWDNANAVHLAKKPVCDALLRDYPSTLIATSGFDVGLPEGTMGNSEVGHQNIGAGRVVDQESVFITKQIRSGEFLNNVEVNACIDHAKQTGGNLHLFGIVSDAGVHGLLEHLFGCIAAAKHRGLTRVFLHAFTDGRDTPPNSGLGYIMEVEKAMKDLGVGKIATVSGRYWAMDRDNRWPRVEKAYRAITLGEGPGFDSAEAAVQHYYNHPSDSNLKGDEFVTPSVIIDPHTKQPLATVKDGDSVLFYNYRGDRPRQLTKAFILDDFTGFPRTKLKLHFTTMTAYEAGLPVHVAYPKPPKMQNILGEYVSKLGKKQFRCAETEKFPHVTFFFNDYREEPFPGEDRVMAPSPKDVKTYDQKPEMAAYEITAAVVAAIESGKYDLLVINFANGDMVGHTGNLPAATRAIEIVDECVGKVLAALKKAGGSAIVTADHGNAEQMIDPTTGGPHTAHTTYTVELIVADDRFKGRQLRTGGRLADVAPTALQMMGLPVPDGMTGKSLIE
ncbi:MAG: 2,3-bisphosphoglycerate-independent phosphoglycerate mutase [Tepidisphaeraceae bacterium]